MLQKSFLRKDKSRAILRWTSISLHDPNATSRWCINSLGKRLFAQPSAIFEGMDLDALLNWDPRSFFSNNGRLFTSLFTRMASSYASLYTSKSLNDVIICIFFP